jgi:hypothetical protein
MSDDFVTVTVTPAPTSTLVDDLRELRDRACDADEQLRREGKHVNGVIVHCGMGQIDRMILALEDAQRDLDEARRLYRVEVRAHVVTAACLTLLLLVVAWWGTIS